MGVGEYECMCVGMYIPWCTMEIEAISEADSPLPPCVYQELNSGHCIWWKEPKLGHLNIL